MPASPRRWSRLRGISAPTSPSGDKQKGRVRRDTEGCGGGGERHVVWRLPWPFSSREGGGLAVSPWMSPHAITAREQCFPHEMARVSTPCLPPPTPFPCGGCHHPGRRIRSPSGHCHTPMTMSQAGSTPPPPPGSLPGLPSTPTSTFNPQDPATLQAVATRHTEGSLHIHGIGDPSQ